jgi:hypothetical protein
MFLVCWTSASCSVLVERDRVQCQTNADCQARGSEFAGAVCSAEQICVPDPTWGCLGQVVFAQPQGGPYKVTILMRDLVTGQPIPGVTARLCQKLDTTCKDPITTADIAANAEGNVVLMLNAGFDGYAELRAPERMPGMYFFYPPVDGDRDIPLVPLLEPALVEQLAVLNGKQLRADRGHILLGGYDCERKAAAGMQLSTEDADADTSAFYVLNNVPKASARETDRSGRGGFINLKPGIVALSATLAGDSRKIATVSLFVRPGMITFTTIVPSP